MKDQGNTGFLSASDFGGTAGAQVWWKMAGHVTHEAIAAVLAQRGLTKLTPSKTSRTRALRRSLEEFTARRTLIRPVTNGVWLVQREIVVKDAAGNDALEYHPWFEARLDIHGDVQLTPKNGTPEPIDQVREAFATALATLDGAALGSWLTSKILPALDAVTIRENGGVYFVPAVGVPLLKAISDVVEHVGPGNIIYRTPVVKADEWTRAILDALRDETLRAVGEVASELGDLEKLSEKGQQSRVATLDGIKNKLARYERIFKTPLLDVESKLLDLRNKIAGARFKAELKDMGAGQAKAEDAASKRFGLLELDDDKPALEPEDDPNDATSNRGRLLELDDDKPSKAAEDDGPGRELDLD